MERGAETDGERPSGPLYVPGRPGPALASLLTEDGVRLEAAYRPPREGGPDALGIVVAHGFTGALRRPAVERAARVFAGYGGVVTFSFRGHGRSGGLSTLGDREVLDVDAAVRWARSLGHRRVATVGFSMGGSVVLRQAGLRPGGVDAVVAVSSPARWYYRGTPPMRRLHWMVLRPGGRLISRLGLRTRIDPVGWGPPEGRTDLPRSIRAHRPRPLPPVAAARLIPPTPLLVVHGDQDPYFPLDHPHSLAAAASSSTLWIEPGFAHAENAATPHLLHRVAGWLATHT